MLSELFTQVVVLSLSAALIALLVMALRLVLKKAPRAVICALWALVAVRLLVPALPQSRVSVVPQPVSEGTVVKEISARPVEETVKIREYEPEYVTILARQPQLPVQKETVAVNGSGSAAAVSAQKDSIKEVKYVEVSAATLEAPKTFGNTVLPVLAWIWLAGVCGMLLYMAFSYARVRRQVQASLPAGDGTFVCDELNSPFILGVIRPRIYLPSALGEEEKSYVLAHEQAHLKRLDHIWKPLGFVLLSLYWFNPVMWAAYVLLCRDIELACDEKVIGREGDGFKKAYSQALIACSAPQRLVTACPLAFGEVGVKTRIKSVLNYRKPAFWILAGAMAVCLVAAGCALTNPKDSQPDASADAVESTPVQSTETGKPAESTPAQTGPQPTVPPETQPVPPESTAEPVDPDAQVWPKEYNVGYLKADQEGVMRADNAAVLPINSFNSTWLPKEPAGSGDFEMSREEFCLYLSRDEKTLVLFTQGGASAEAIKTGAIAYLHFCQDPRSAVRCYVSENATSLSGLYYAVLDIHTVWLLDPDDLPAFSPVDRDGRLEENPDVLSAPLPAGMTADGVREMTRVMDPETQTWALVLISDRLGNWRLNLQNMTWEPTELGYHVSRDGDTVTVRSASAVWTLEIPQKDVRVIGTVSYTSLGLCVVEDDGLSASLYCIAALPGEGDTAELITYRSTVDMSDWVTVPEHFARGNGYTVDVMAPRGLGVTFSQVVVGQSNVEKDRESQTLKGLRERILGGEVIELMDGAEITDDFPELNIDLDGDGAWDRFSVEKGVNTQYELCYEFYYNGKAAGCSSEVYRSAYDPDLDISRFHWPEEADFRRNAGYMLYLASMDGEHILVFISNGEETWGVSFVRTVDVSGESVRFYAVARIRGVGKSMNDFVPNQTLEQYIADGWLVRPMDGDALDISGSGSKNMVRVSYEGFPVYEKIGVYPVSRGGSEPDDTALVAWEAGDLTTRYDQLYYAPNPTGGYDLLGEISFGQNWHCDRLRLTDGNWRLISGSDEEQMAFQKSESAGTSLPGRVGASAEALQAFDTLRGTAPYLDAESLRAFELYFRDDFVPHFLLSEYEDVRDISLEELFFDGPCTGFLESLTRPRVERNGEEENTVYETLFAGWGARLQLIKTPVAEMEALLQKYTGYGLKDMRSEEMPGGYVEKYDAYYAAHGDGLMTYVHIADGALLPDGSVMLLWTQNFFTEENLGGIVRLVPGEDGWKIRSNLIFKPLAGGGKGVAPTDGIYAVVRDNWKNIFPMRSPMLRQEDGEESLLFTNWTRQIIDSVAGWDLPAHRVSAAEETDQKPDYTVRLHEYLEIAALRRDHYNVNTTSRLNGGQREYYGWINGEAYWLPKVFIDTVENWYQMPMEEQLAEHSVSFYERVYAQASPTERRKLELLYPEIRDPQRVSEYCREIRIAAGLAPDDMPRITLEQAKELCREVQEEIENDYQAQLSELIARLNEITGGPDWVGGSGFTTSIYYLNEGKTAGISIVHLGLGLVMYCDDDGTKTVLMSPSPTAQP